MTLWSIVSSQGFLAISTGAGRCVAESERCDGGIGRRGEDSSLEGGRICSCLCHAHPNSWLSQQKLCC